MMNIAPATALTTWEAVLDDDTTVREAEGNRYADVSLERLEVFRLVRDGQTIFATERPPGALGTAFRYRRRGIPSTGEHYVLLGWEPHGPAFLVDPAALDTDRVGVWVADQGFHTEDVCRCGTAHPVGWFDAPVPLGAER